MSKVKLDLKSKNDVALLTFATEHRDALAGNPNFPIPQPDAATFDADLADYSTRLSEIAAAETTLQILRTQKDNARKKVESQLSDRGTYVDLQSQGSEAVILSAGFGIQAKGTTTTSIDKPSNVSAKMGRNGGEIEVTCDAVPRAKSYIAEAREHSDTAVPVAWGTPRVSTRSAVKFIGLIPGKKYAFRLRALGPNDLESPWSNEVFSMAP